MVGHDAAVSGRQVAVLQLSIIIVALCGIIYELLIATVSSYLLGDSVRQFSITIGLFMAAMGLGAYLTKRISGDLITIFVIIEVIIALIGGLSCALLFLVFPHTAFYQPTMYLLIIVIGSLVGMEIPILMRVLSQCGSIRDSIAEVLSLDYFGALLGSVAFPLFLLPFFGLFKASFFIGFINICIALITIAAFRATLRYRNLLWSASLLVTFLLGFSFFSAHSISSYAEGQLYTDQIVYERQTPYQKIVVTRNQQTGNHRLFLDGHIQFAEVDEYRYHEALVHPLMSGIHPGSEVLILGGGDGMAAREILKYPEVAGIDLVDLDEEMTDLCASFEPIARLNQGALTDPRVTIHNIDAWLYIRQIDKRYDRIIIDLPDPHNESLNKLYSIEFYKQLKPRLQPDGMVVTQSTSPLITTNTFWSIGSTLHAAGLHIHRYQISLPSFSGSWGFTIAKVSGNPPQYYDIPTHKTRFLTTEVMAGAHVFGKDEQPSGAIVNSIFQPKLYLTYNEDVSRW